MRPLPTATNTSWPIQSSGPDIIASPIADVLAVSYTRTRPAAVKRRQARHTTLYGCRHHALPFFHGALTSSPKKIIRCVPHSEQLISSSSSPLSSSKTSSHVPPSSPPQPQRGRPSSPPSPLPSSSTLTRLLCVVSATCCALLSISRVAGSPEPRFWPRGPRSL